MKDQTGGDRAIEIVCVKRPNDVDEVNEVAYLSANPDVHRAGMTARDHFLMAGQREGRIQGDNLDQVAAIREKKLQRLRYRREPAQPRAYGAPANFLTPQIIADFGIPEAPPVSANQYGGPFIDEIIANNDRLCLDVGAGLRYSYVSNIVNTEIYPSISTDIMCVGEDLPFESDQFDYAI